MSAGRNGEATAEEDLLKDQSLSYRYWVGSRGDGSEAAAPAAKPKKLTVEEAAILQRNSSQGSAWNQVIARPTPTLGPAISVIVESSMRTLAIGLLATCTSEKGLL